MRISSLKRVAIANFTHSCATGDRVRTGGARLRLALLTLRGPGVRDQLVEAASNEVYEAFNRTGRFQISGADAIRTRDDMLAHVVRTYFANSPEQAVTALLRMSDVDIEDTEVKRLRETIRRARQSGR